MSMKALVDIVKRIASLPTAAYLTTGAITSAAVGIDFANCYGNKVDIGVGVLTDGVYAPVVEVSADNSTWAAAAAGDLVYPSGVSSLANLASNVGQSFSYIGASRYLRVRFTVTGSPATGAVVGTSAHVTYRKQP